MNEKTTTKKQRVIYYSILAVLLVAIGVVTAIAISQSNKPDISIDSSTSDSNDDSAGNVTPPVNDDSSSTDNEDKPVVQVISFITPVQNGVLFKEFTDNTVVFNSTLGVYTGHMGMDFKGPENAKVVAVYKGTVKEITTSYLEGTTVKIDHGNGLITVYNSIEPIETLKIGLSVKQGEVLGTISANNKQEYKDGPHLHFEVIENGVKISPLKYLTIEEK